ncbi:hypothetical protein CK203_064098 [Vitis vinifera]|uniref:Uncharacterized protein n=1 Tax=Vitis vinifera TaxID=29760 RepID=A0A438G3Y3_VITVI|nr:hypothetical protein CK203_064098 [Vitis vinifera]
MKEVPRGGRSWFAVESKSFEILIDEVGEVEMIEAGPLFGRRREGSTGKGLSGGWNVLAEKLREVGVVPIGGLKNPLSIEVLKKEKELEPRTYADVAKSKMGRLGDKVWLELGRRVKSERLEQLDCCLVGRWENGANPPPSWIF